jgi:hypothetical protein
LSAPLALLAAPAALEELEEPEEPAALEELGAAEPAAALEEPEAPEPAAVLEELVVQVQPEAREASVAPEVPAEPEARAELAGLDQPE